MKKLSFITVILTFCFVSAFSQACPDSLYLTSQAQIDSFQINYPSCSEIEGSVIISGSDITNLLGLMELTSIGGDLLIGTMYYYGNPYLINLSGLNNLTSIGGRLLIIDNHALTSLSGLDNVTSIGGDLSIKFNNALTSLAGLDNVTFIGGNVDIMWNEALTNLTGLNNLTSIGDYLSIRNNDALTSLSGLENVTSIGGGPSIYDNDALTSLTGLEGLTSIGWLSISSNSSLTTLTGLEGLTSIGESLSIGGNASLTNLTGLVGLTSIGGDLSIIYNHALTSLTGLDNINLDSITDLSIYNNNLLSFCDILSICNYLSNPTGTIEIDENTTGCNSQEEVQDSCEAHAGLNDISYLINKLSLYPNPAHQELNITAEGYNIDEVSIYTLTGQQVMQERPVNGTIDISHLQPGMYIVEVVVENRKIRQKLLVQ